MMRTTLQPGLTAPKRMGATKPKATAPRFGETKAEAEDLFRQAAMRGDKATLLGFIQAGKIDINAPNSFGDTAVMFATSENQLKALKILIDEGADLNKQSQSGRTAVILAVSHNRPDALKLLIEAKANLDLQDAQEHATAAIHAVKKNDINALKLLIEAKANLDLPSYSGESPLMVAATLKTLDALKLLIKAKVNPNHQNASGYTATMKAAAIGNTAVLKLLIEAGADLNLQDPTYGNTAAMWAACHNQKDTLQMLINADAKLDFKNKAGETITAIARKQGHTEILKLLQQPVIPKELSPDEVNAFLKAYNMPIEG